MIPSSLRRDLNLRHTNSITALLAGLTVLLAGCGGGSSSSSTSTPTPSPTPSPISSPSPTPSPIVSPFPIGVTIRPETAQVLPGTTQQFQSSVTSTMDSSVLWSVREGTSGGVITSSGVYTAPAEAGIYHVVVASGADTERTAVATVTVPIVVTLTPASIKTTLLRPVSFTASVNSSQNPGVTWSIQEGNVGGTISSDGTYTPPDHAGIFHIVATSVADNKQQSIATVTVEAGGASGAIQ